MPTWDDGVRFIEYLKANGAALKAVALPLVVIVAAVALGAWWLSSRYFAGRLSDYESRIALRDDEIKQKNREIEELKKNQAPQAVLDPNKSPDLAGFFIGSGVALPFDGGVIFLVEIIIGNSGRASEVFNVAMGLVRPNSTDTEVLDVLPSWPVPINVSRTVNGEQRGFVVRPGDFIQQRAFRRRIPRNQAIRGFVVGRTLESTLRAAAGGLMVVSFVDDTGRASEVVVEIPDNEELRSISKP